MWQQLASGLNTLTAFCRSVSVFLWASETRKTRKGKYKTQTVTPVGASHSHLRILHFSHTLTGVNMHTLTAIALLNEALAVLESLLSQSLLWRQQAAGGGSCRNHRNHWAVHLRTVICSMKESVSVIRIRRSFMLQKHWDLENDHMVKGHVL